jgi:hypothetical protein
VGKKKQRNQEADKEEDSENGKKEGEKERKKRRETFTHLFSLSLVRHVALGQGVEECLLRIFMQQGSQSLDKAQDYLHRMLEKGRYHVDIFA